MVTAKRLSKADLKKKLDYAELKHASLLEDWQVLNNKNKTLNQLVYDRKIQIEALRAELKKERAAIASLTGIWRQSELAWLDIFDLIKSVNNIDMKKAISEAIEEAVIKAVIVERRKARNDGAGT